MFLWEEVQKKAEGFGVDVARKGETKMISFLFPDRQSLDVIAIIIGYQFVPLMRGAGG